MINWIDSLIENTVQCWGCDLFDRLFSVVSIAAGYMYQQVTFVAFALFIALFIAFLFNAVFKNIKDGGKDPLYTKSVLRIIINALVVLSLLFVGVGVPRAVTQFTVEPATTLVLAYSTALTKSANTSGAENITYTPRQLDEDEARQLNEKGIFRTQLRDTIITLMKNTTVQFQSYMKVGVAIVNAAFRWKEMLGIGAIVKHFAMMMIGVFLIYGFFKIFINFCFIFADVLVAMALFAFMFPISLMLMIFDGAEHVPDVVKNINKNVSKDQIKKMINAIVSMGACILTYTIMVLIVTNFFTDASPEQLLTSITNGNIFELDINDSNLEALSLVSCTVLVYVLIYIYKQIPQITKMILETFGVSEEHKTGDALAAGAMTLTKSAVGVAKNVVKVPVNKFLERTGLAKEKTESTEKTEK